MIKISYILICTIFIFISNSAYSQMLVSDPSGLAQRAQEAAQEAVRFAKQHGEMVTQTTQMTKTVTNTAQSVQQLTQQLESITGNLKLSSPLLDSIQNTLNQYSNLTTALPSKMVDGRSVNNRKTEDIKILLKGITSDHSDRRKDVYEPLRQKYHADSQHAALTLSEFIINNNDDNIKSISDDIKSADSNQTLKEAIDVNNKILLQLAITQQQQTQLLAQLVRATVSRDFDGLRPNAQRASKSSSEINPFDSSNSKSSKIDVNSLPFKIKGKSLTSEVFKGGF